MVRRLGFCFLWVVLAACSSTSESRPDAAFDAVSVEAGRQDAPLFDAPLDAAILDVSPRDGLSSDVSPRDTHAPDTLAGQDVAHTDADAADGGALDASVLDAPLDASVLDAPLDAAVLDTQALDGNVQESGGLGCEELAYDPVLGTAKLGAAYSVVDSATLPVTSWLPVALVDEALAGGGVGQVVYGYAGDGRVHRLGVWPNLSAPSASNVAFDPVAAADRAYQIVTTPMLVTTGGRLLASYRTLRSAAFVGGGVSVFDTAHPEAGTQWIAATGVESALGLGSYLLVGGDSLGTVANGRGVYGVDTNGSKPLSGQIAKYPVIPSENVRPGPMAVTSSGLVVMGYYLDLAERHSLRLVEPSQLMEALSGGPAIELAKGPELTQADDVANLTSFGQGVAVLHTRKVSGILPALGRLDHYALSRSGGDAGTVVSAPVPILSAADADACTVVSQLVPVAGGMTVIVGLWDRNGQRLVRLAPR